MSDSYNIMFLGPSGAGKTTLLASFYKEVLHSSNSENSEVSVTCLNPARQADLESSSEAINQVESNRPFDFEVKLQGTQGILHYPFDLKLNQESLLNFQVIDHKGGDIKLNTIDPEIKNLLVSELIEANCIFVVVDAAVMMADIEGFNANYFNQYTAISEYLHHRLSQSQKPVLIQFLLTKCEKWWRGDARHNPKLGGALMNKAKESLHQSIKIIEDRAREGYPVVSVMTPTITLNCVEFWRKVPHANPQKFDLSFKRRPNIPYKSETSLPILRAMAFCLTQSLQEGNVLQKWWNRKKRAQMNLLLEKLSMTSHMTQSVEELYGNKQLLDFKTDL